MPAPQLLGMSFEPLGRSRIGAEVIVQIEEHGGTFGGGAQQVAKSSQDARPDHVAFVGSEQPEIQVLIREDVEMIEPEIG